MGPERGAPADLQAIRALLVSNALPCDDLDLAGAEAQWIWREEGQVVGTVGVDILGAEAVFRSVAVAPPHRGRGIAARLCREAEGAAHKAGVATVYLLTESAKDFFEGLGFRPVPRSDVPLAVARHRQFASGCCTCAVTMMKRLN